MAGKVPTKNLEEVDYVSHQGTDELFHVYGIFKQEERIGATLIWRLFDEYKTVAFYLLGKPEDYPRPRRGDVVRIHRVRIGALTKRPEIVHGRNVVYWPAFEYDPKPMSSAKKPTITNDDHTRRRVLDALYCSTITKSSDLSRTNDNFYDIAGRVESICLDKFEHYEITYTDGTESRDASDRPRVVMMLKIFKPSKPEESQSHYEVARSLKLGQYFVATNAKRYRLNILHLSANEYHGRSFRLVDRASILGIKLSESLQDEAPIVQQEANPGQSNADNNRPLPLRRSPRLRQGCDNNNTPNDPPIPHETGRDEAEHVSAPTIKTAQAIPLAKRQPPFHLFSEITTLNRESAYVFHNLVGVVRTKPKLTRQYGNCTFQIFDGSKHELKSSYQEEYEKGILDGCLVLYIYSAQAQHDINDHFKRAMEELNVGDLVYVKNVKISFPKGECKLEMQANNRHGKSIEKIDSYCPFGELIQNTVNTRIDLLSQESSDFDQEPETIPESETMHSSIVEAPQ